MNPFHNSNRRPARAAALVLWVLLAVGAAAGPAAAESRHAFADSVVEPSASRGASIVRTSLTPTELAAPMNVVVNLQMRDADRFEALVSSGHRIPQAELAATYLPTAADYEAIVAWLGSQRLEVTQTDPNRMAVFARGSVEQVRDAFAVTFARVATADGEFTSAVTAPSLPSSLAASVAGISGLQPHRRLHRQGVLVRDYLTSGSGAIILVPGDIVAAYDVPSTLSIGGGTITPNGSGQTIAVIMDGTVSTADLSTFWSSYGGTATTQTTSRFTAVAVGGGPSSSSSSNDANQEATLDVEWAGGVAPGAKIRLYEVPDLSDASFIQAIDQILSDASADDITVVSISAGGPESDYGGVTPETHRYYGLLANAGITVLAASGDGGSRPPTSASATTDYYSLSNPLGAEYPASDPYVTGVGGTIMELTSSYGYSGETTWFETDNATEYGTGGGYSSLFSKPSWQADGASVLGNATVRCVPDVAAIAEADESADQYVLLYVNSTAYGVFGTSLSCPIWAGVVATLNQARAAGSLSALGLLGSSIYPLHASCFRDITTGANGTDGYYTATTGYNLSTGLGTPLVDALINALAFAAPTITSQPQSTSTTVGNSFSLSVTATGTAPLTYQWYLGGSAISGAASSTYSVGSASSSNAGSYTVTVSNQAGSVTSNAATVTVTAASTATSDASTGGSGGGGGGGAPSLGFCAALAAAAGARLVRRRRRLPDPI